MEETREMTLTLKSTDSGRKVEITCSEDSDIFEIMVEIRGLLVAWGYHPNSIVDGCTAIVEEYEDKEGFADLDKTLGQD